jgi:polyhydroxyalkanoate synthesis regulator phasin
MFYDASHINKIIDNISVSTQIGTKALQTAIKSGRFTLNLKNESEEFFNRLVDKLVDMGKTINNETQSPFSTKVSSLIGRVTDSISEKSNELKEKIKSICKDILNRVKSKPVESQQNFSRISDNLNAEFERFKNSQQSYAFEESYPEYVTDKTTIDDIKYHSNDKVAESSVEQLKSLYIDDNQGIDNLDQESNAIVGLLKNEELDKDVKELVGNLKGKSVIEQHEYFNNALASLRSSYNSEGIVQPRDFCMACLSHGGNDLASILHSIGENQHKILENIYKKLEEYFDSNQDISPNDRDSSIQASLGTAMSFFATVQSAYTSLAAINEELS